jgi:hypothetical protein
MQLCSLSFNGGGTTPPQLIRPSPSNQRALIHSVRRPPFTVNTQLIQLSGLCTARDRCPNLGRRNASPTHLVVGHNITHEPLVDDVKATTVIVLTPQMQADAVITGITGRWLNTNRQCSTTPPCCHHAYAGLKILLMTVQSHKHR